MHIQTEYFLATNQGSLMKLRIITFLALSLFFDSYTAHQAVVKKNAANNGWGETEDGIEISGPPSDSSTIEEEQKGAAYDEQEIPVCPPYGGKGAVPTEVAVRLFANLEIRKKKLHGEKLPVPRAPQAPRSLPQKASSEQVLFVTPNASGNHWGITENGEEISGPPQDHPTRPCQPYIRKHITDDGIEVWDF